MQGLRSSHILYHNTQPIAHWILMLEKMNTRYVKNGSLLNPERYEEWKQLSDEGETIGENYDLFCRTISRN